MNDVGFSTYSNSLNVFWNPEPLGTITASGINDGLNAVINWQADLKYHDGFKVERATTSAGPFEPLTTFPVTATSFTQTLTEGQTYSYRVVAFNSAGSITSNTVTVVITGIEEGDSEVTLFPNPATNVIHFSKYDLSTSGSVEVISAEGKVYNAEISGSSFDVSHLPTGIYVLRYRTEGRVKNFRFTKN